MRRLLINLTLLILGGLLLDLSRAAEQPDRPILLAVHPYLPYQELQRRYRPLAEYLSEVLDRTVLVRVGRDYGEHISHIGKDQVDIAYIGPATYVYMVEKYGRKPLLARLEVNGKPVFHGYLVTNANSGVTDIQSLRGKRFAFGDPASTMSHLVPRHMLLEAGLDVSDLEDYQFLSSHRNVALAVLAGAFEAGAVKEEVMETFRDRGLIAFAQSAPFSEHLFLARSNAAEEFIETVREALLGLSDTPQGREILHSIKQTATGLVPVEDSDYDNLRAVLLQLHEHGVE
jgi:phosphonate transport system substrate-binding protein